MKNEIKEDLRVRLREGLKEQLEAVYSRGAGSTQVAAVNELVAWFIRQDERFQAHILGKITLTPQELAALFAITDNGAVSKTGATDGDLEQTGT